MSESTHKSPRSWFKVASDANEFFLPKGTDKMVNDKYKEWLKRRSLDGKNSTSVNFYPRSKAK
jgi:hypothetical protein